jgi:hypothetical protein
MSTDGLCLSYTFSNDSLTIDHGSALPTPLNLAARTLHTTWMRIWFRASVHSDEFADPFRTIVVTFGARCC